MDVEREYHDRTRGAYASRDLGCGKVQAGRLHRRHLAKAAFAFQFLATARGPSTSLPFHTRTLAGALLPPPLHSPVLALALEVYATVRLRSPRLRG
jgi:hypothetical protein